MPEGKDRLTKPILEGAKEGLVEGAGSSLKRTLGGALIGGIGAFLFYLQI